MAKRTCGVSECDRPVIARELCSMHYQRMWKTGSTDAPAPRLCSVDECGKPHRGRGYCGTHLKRMQTSGALTVVPRIRRVCTYPACGRPAVSNSLCTGHAQQAKRGSELHPLRPKRKSTTRDEQGRKQCSHCDGWKPETHFYPSARQDDGLATVCKRCDRSLRLQRNYGISADRYDELLVEQGGGCAICGAVARDGHSLAVDHDHACCPTRKKSCGTCVRGLLCEDCNRALGMLNDQVSRFRAAITYLGGSV